MERDQQWCCSEETRAYSLLGLIGMTPLKLDTLPFFLEEQSTSSKGLVWRDDEQMVAAQRGSLYGRRAKFMPDHLVAPFSVPERQQLTGYAKVSSLPSALL